MCALTRANVKKSTFPSDPLYRDFHPSCILPQTEAASGPQSFHINWILHYLPTMGCYRREAPAVAFTDTVEVTASGSELLLSFFKY